jgi:hypothetical protein
MFLSYKNGSLGFDLSMNEDDGPKETPCSTLSIYMEHAQNLQEANSPDGRRSKYLPVGTHREHHNGSHHHYQI